MNQCRTRCERQDIYGKGTDLYHSVQSRHQDEQAQWHSAGGPAEGREELIHKPGNSQSGRWYFRGCKIH